MSPLVWIIGGLLFMGAVLFALALCRAAAAGDRAIKRTRRELAGPDNRRRIGL